MKKNHSFLKKITSILMAFLMVLTVMCMSPQKVQAVSPEGYVTISMEKFTLGLGYIIEPVKVPFYTGDNGANIITRLMEDYGYEYENNGSVSDTSGVVGSTFYLARVKDDDYREAQIPQYILNEIQKDDKELWGRIEEGWLGEFDYTNMSGWMYCVNNVFPNYGASTYKPKDGDIIRWQYSVYGYGSDISDNSEYDNPGYLDYANKDKLTEKIAEINSSSDKAKLLDNTKIKQAYDEAMDVLQDMTSTQDSVNNAYNKLSTAIKQQEQISVIFDADNGSDVVVKNIDQGDKLDYTPENPTKKGYTFIGWYKDVDDVTTAYKSGNTYIENATYKAKWAHVQMLGAQGKKVVDDKSGIRFGTKIYNDGDQIIEKGTLIIPANLLSEGEALTLYTEKVARSVGKTNYEVNKDENYVTYLGTIVNISKEKFDVEITAAAYVIYKDKAGNEYTVYSQYPNGSTSVCKLLGISVN